MAEIIYLRDVQAARERAGQRASEHQNIGRALQLMRENLTDVVEQLQSARLVEQPELLDRIDKLTAMIRYGLRMLGEPVDGSKDASNGARQT